MEFLHTMIRVKNIEKSLKFYCELLDMKIVKQKQFNDDELYFLTDERGIVQLELSYNKNASEDGYNFGSGFGHFGFKVTSIDEFTQKMESLGYEYSQKPYQLPNGGSIIAFVKDPDGYEVELIQKSS